MHSTKTEILALLKRSDGASVDDISVSIGLAAMTVRQHLSSLERDALVQAREVRRHTGRPHFRYSLTEDGHRSISQGYDRLIPLLMDAVAALNVPEARLEVVRAAAGALAERHRAEIAQLPARGRVERAVAILRSHGGFAEYHERDGLFELRDFSCLFRQSLGSEGPCEWHGTFLRGVLGREVEAAPDPHDGCAACCRYVIPGRALALAPVAGDGRGRPSYTKELE
jgi:predicted ArsR family transcriptional regulator